MTFGLQGRVALITGASRGIGFAIANALQEQGVRVALISRDEEALKSAAATLPAPGPNDVLTLGADVTDTESVRNAVAKAHSWGGRLDIVVNCAGPEVTFSELADTPTEVLAGALDAKLLGFHRVASAALPLLSESGSGRIINIAGAAALTLIPNLGVTGITNAAILALTNYLASEATAKNVLVNAISPGMTLTDGQASRLESIGKSQGQTVEEVSNGIAAASGIRIGRWADPAEIANAVVFLASDLSTYMTGSVLEVDGGISKAVL
jgi:3-oxoacyl-[acyl-carrier protein] reductase